MSEFDFSKSLQTIGATNIDDYRQKKGAKGTYSVIIINNDHDNLSISGEWIGSYKNEDDMVNIVAEIQNFIVKNLTANKINKINKISDVVLSNVTVSNASTKYKLTFSFTVNGKIIHYLTADNYKETIIFRVYTNNKKEYDTIFERLLEKYS